MVYIDKANSNSGWSHLVSDCLEELHSFAVVIGLKKDWFQNIPGKPHYDVKGIVRRNAIKKGAIVVSSKEIVNLLKYHYN